MSKAAPADPQAFLPRLSDVLRVDAFDLTPGQRPQVVLGVACDVTVAWPNGAGVAPLVVLARPHDPAPRRLQDWFPALAPAADRQSSSIGALAVAGLSWAYIDSATALDVAAARSILSGVGSDIAMPLDAPIPPNGALLLTGRLAAPDGLPLGKLAPALLAAIGAGQPLHGRVDDRFGAPELRVALPFDAAIAGLSAGARLALVAPLVPDAAHRVTLSGGLDLGGGQAVTVSIDVPRPDAPILATASYGAQAALGVLRDEGWPAEPRGPAAEVSATLTLDIEGGRLVARTLRFSLALANLNLVPAPVDLTLRELVFDVAVSGVTGARIVTAGAAATATLGGLALACSGWYPMGRFELSASRPSASTAGALVGALGGELGDASLGALAVDDFVLQYDVGPKRLVASIAVVGAWAMPPFPLKVEALQLMARREETTQLSLAALLAIGRLRFGLWGTFDAAGWRFAGAALGQPSLADVLDCLQEHFGAPVRLPAPLDTVRIRAFAVSFARRRGDGTAENITFRLDAAFEPAPGRPLDVQLGFTKSASAGSRPYDLAGTITVGPTVFKLELDQQTTGGAGDAWLVATLDARQGLALQDILDALPVPRVALPFQLTIAGAAIALRRATAAGASGTRAVFALRLAGTHSLSALPLVGGELADDRLENVALLYTTDPVTSDELAAINARLPSAVQLPVCPVVAPAPALAAGVSFAGDLTLQGRLTSLLVPNPSKAAPAPASSGSPRLLAPTTAAQPVAAQGQASGADWFDVEKSIGPVHLARVGVGYESGHAWVLFDASFRVGGLRLSLDGLGLGFELRNFRDVAVTLLGLSIDYTGGDAFTIGGTLVRSGGDYLGQVLVRAATFSLSAFGGYSTAPEPSFLVFARLDEPLGGPPYFFVTGLAAGFGVNRSIVVPAVDELANFALLPRNAAFPAGMPAGPAEKAAQLQSALDAVRRFSVPQRGQNWLAAGIDFTSFQMVESSALLTVAFGVKLEIALVGLSRVTIPKGAPQPVAYAEIALEARLSEEAELLAVDGRLTPASFIYAGACHLTGGFAFYSWFSGPHEGEVVVCLGGYHPRFQPPGYYPSVPRLGMVYEVGNLVVKGQAYFALVPHALMAGIQMEATWHSGDVRAWFNAGIDFLMAWQPFHYEASAWIHLGASFTLDLALFTITVEVHLGVDLYLWGPPFGGRAVIDLDVISFSIGFGADQRRESLDWAGFKTAFLTTSSARPRVPAMATAAATHPDAVLCTARVGRGLVQDLSEAAELPPGWEVRGGEGGRFRWVLDPNAFRIDVTTQIPSKRLFIHGREYGPQTRPDLPLQRLDALPAGTASPRFVQQFGILPLELGADQFTSVLTIALTRSSGADHTDPASYTDPAPVAAVAVYRAAQTALYGTAKPGLDPNAATTIPGTLSGVRLAPEAQRPEKTVDADLYAMMFDPSPPVVGWRPAAPPGIAVTHGDVVPDQGTLVVPSADGKERIACTGWHLTVLADPATAAARESVLDSLRSMRLLSDLPAVDVQTLATRTLWDWPMIRTLGEEASA